MASVKESHRFRIFIKIDKYSLVVLLLDLHPLRRPRAPRERVNQRHFVLVQVALDVERVFALPPLVGDFVGGALADRALVGHAAALRAPEGAVRLQVHSENPEEFRLLE